MERRLQLGLAVFLLLLTVVIWGAVNRSFHLLVEDIIVSRLMDDSENMIAALEPDPAYTNVRWRRINSIYNEVNSGHYYQFSFADGRTIASPSLWDKALDVPQLAVGTETRYQTGGPNGENLQVWARHFTKDGYDITLAVAEDLAAVREHRQRFKRIFALVLIGGFLGLLVLQSWLVRRAFRQLVPLHRDLRLVELGNRRTLTEDVPDEVKPLVSGFNRLLELLAQRLTRSRNALGNLAHALKGPLNLLMQSLDGIKGPEGEQARAQAGRIRKLISRELKRARLAGQGGTTQRFAAEREMPDLAGLLKQAHSGKNLEISYEIPHGLPLFGDREDMLELTGNVLENACKWAHGLVRVRFSNGERYRILIEDDGPGVTPDQLAELTQRGVRFDENTEGSGLGLSIARDIVGLYGGTLRFAKSADFGGLLVEMDFPVSTV
ncbi:MAG: ATP-binding protein [Rhodobacteraceae bacterium]|nr:ATP-binding protein [Paracoccaceae bacterium]